MSNFYVDLVNILKAQKSENDSILGLDKETFSKFIDSEVLAMNPGADSSIAFESLDADGDNFLSETELLDIDNYISNVNKNATTTTQPNTNTQASNSINTILTNGTTTAEQLEAIKNIGITPEDIKTLNASQIKELLNLMIANNATAPQTILTDPLYQLIMQNVDPTVYTAALDPKTEGNGTYIEKYGSFLNANRTNLSDSTENVRDRVKGSGRRDPSTKDPGPKSAPEPQTKEELQAAIESRRQDLATEKGNLQNAKNTVSQQKANIDSKAQAIQDNNKDRDNTDRTMQGQISTAEADLENATRTAMETNNVNQEIKAEYERQVTEIDGQITDITDNKIPEQNSAIDSATENIKTNTNIIDTSTSTINTQTDVKEIQAQVAIRQEGIINAKGETIDKIDRMTRSLSNQRDSAQDQETKDAIQSKIRNLSGDRASATRAKNNAVRDKRLAEEKQAQAQEAINKAQSDLDTAQGNLASAQEALNTAQNTKTTLESDRTKLQTDKSNLLTTLQEKYNDPALAKVQEVIAEKKQVVQDLIVQRGESLKNIDAQIKTDTDDMNNLTKGMKTTTDTIKVSQNNIDAINQDLQKYEVKLTSITESEEVNNTFKEYQIVEDLSNIENGDVTQGIMLELGIYSLDDIINWGSSADDKKTRFAKLTPEMQEDVLRLAVYAQSQGHTIGFNSPQGIFRTYDEQVRTYATSRPGYAAKPGRSLHGKGLAVDINVDGSRINQTSETVRMLADYWTKDLGNSWGGNWKSIFEPWHFEIRK